MELTPRADGLVEPVRAVLDQIRSTISVNPPFDPATSGRTISIMASDYSTEVLLAPAFRTLSGEAPNVRFEVQPMNAAPVDALERGQVDLLLTIDFAISTEHPSRALFEDDHVVVGWSGNPAMAEPMTPELYLALGHVTARFGKGRVPAFEDWFVRRTKQQRRVEIVAPTFLSVAGLVIGSDRIATMHRRLATRLATYLPLGGREAPFAIPAIRQALQWHITSDKDLAIRWAVDQLAAMAARETPSVMSASADDGRALAQEFRSSTAT